MRDEVMVARNYVVVGERLIPLASANNEQSDAHFLFVKSRHQAPSLASPAPQDEPLTHHGFEVESAVDTITNVIMVTQLHEETEEPSSSVLEERPGSIAPFQHSLDDEETLYVFKLAEMDCARLEARGYATSIGEAMPDCINDTVVDDMDDDEMKADFIDHLENL